MLTKDDPQTKDGPPISHVTEDVEEIEKHYSNQGSSDEGENYDHIDDSRSAARRKARCSLFKKCLNGIFVSVVTVYMISNLALFGDSIKNEGDFAYFMLQAVAWSANLVYVVLLVVLSPCMCFYKCFRGSFDFRTWATFSYRTAPVIGLIVALNYYGTGGVSSKVAKSVQCVLSQCTMPLTAIIEWLYLRKKFNCWSVIILAGVVVGGVVSIIPELVGGVTSPIKDPVWLYCLWILAFALGNGIYSIVYILTRQTLQLKNTTEDESEPRGTNFIARVMDALIFCSITNVFVTIWLFAVPGWALFGMNFFSFQSLKQYGTKVINCLQFQNGTRCEGTTVWFLGSFCFAMIFNNLFTTYAAAVESGTFVAILSVGSPMIASFLFHFPALVFLIWDFKIPFMYDYAEMFVWWDICLFCGFVVSMVCIIAFILYDRNATTKRKASWLYKILDPSLSCKEWCQTLVCCCLKKRTRVANDSETKPLLDEPVIYVDTDEE